MAHYCPIPGDIEHNGLKRQEARNGAKVAKEEIEFALASLALLGSLALSPPRLWASGDCHPDLKHASFFRILS